MINRLLFPLLILLIGCSEGYNDTDINLEQKIPEVHINMNTPLEYVSKNEYSNGTIQIENSEGLLSMQPTAMGLRGRGNTTWSFPKKPFQIRFEEAIEVLGMPGARKWILLAHYTDKSLLRTELALELSRNSFMDWTSDGEFIELYVNAEYLGVYQLVEKIEAVPNRVNDGQGFLLEVNRQNRLGPNDIYFESNYHFYVIKEPEVITGDFQYSLIEEYVETTEDVLFGLNFQDPFDGYRKYLDVQSFIDWYIIHEITMNSESAWSSSCYMNYVPGGKLKMGPVWDFDLSLGNSFNARSVEGFKIKNAGWYAQLFQDSLFVNEVKQRFQYFYAHKEDILTMIDNKSQLLEEAQDRNFVKWPILGVWVWPNAVAFTEYDHEVTYLKYWYSDRMEWLNQAIENL
tara:strand:+ start:581 stop:1783 length:1203 start_codon:yes stop_codon:yes gene_type:complete